ncbi:MAG TPA: high frequency lysogenization protein HflD [Gemmatimonadaceae bacterium]|nr:high frequency lysogenization protein HflD [Gemmatimonadaceae bacterium]
MREERVIALAGVLQAAGLVRNLAVRGQIDATAMRISLASIFKIDADNAADVFGGVANLRFGLETLVAQVESGQRDTGLTRLLINIMRLERVLAGRSDVLRALRDGIETIGRDPADADFGAAIPRLAQLYANTLSTLRPRILVEGTPRFLTDPANVDRIRALLLAGIRSTVLWRQVGGSNWRLFFRHRQYAMMARGLLAQCTLSGS